MELADTILITKADSGNEKASQLAARSYANAVHLFPAKESDWITNVLTTSSIDNKGLSEAWENLKSFFNVSVSNGFFFKESKGAKCTFFKRKLCTFNS